MAVVPIDTGASSKVTYYSELKRLGVRDTTRVDRYVEASLTKAGARTLRDELDKYVDDKPKPVGIVDPEIYIVPKLDTAVADMVKSALDKLAHQAAVPSWDVRSGDKLKLYGREAIVTNVRSQRDYRGETATVEFALLVPPVPPKPSVPVVKVGDVINGDTLRAVQWKRGTVITPTDGGSSYALRADGKWQYLNGSTSHTFGEFRGGKYRVDYAPGKAA